MAHRIGYIRVSSIDQNTDRQLEGIQLDQTFTEKASGKDTNRPELQRMLETVRAGDMVLVHSMDRLARNLSDLLNIVKTLTEKGIAIQFSKENLTFTGNDDAIAVMMLQIIGAVAQFERSIIKARQAEGIAIAKAKGVYKKHGAKPEMTPERVAEIKSRVEAGEPKARIAKALGISRDTLYRYL